METTVISSLCFCCSFPSTRTLSGLPKGLGCTDWWGALAAHGGNENF